MSELYIRMQGKMGTVNQGMIIQCVLNSEKDKDTVPGENQKGEVKLRYDSGLFFIINHSCIQKKEVGGFSNVF